MLDRDSPRIGAGQIADQLFVRRWGLERILAQCPQQAFSFLPQTCRGIFLRVLLRLFGKDNLPLHQPRSFTHFPTEVASPFRMDRLMPGIERR